MTFTSKIIALFFALFLCIFPALAQNELSEIQPSASGVLLYFSKEPAILSSEIAPNKSKITLLLKSTNVAERAREASGKGIIENIFAQQGKEKDRENAVVYVMLKEKSGYSLALLPYSRAIQLALIDWQKLVPRENYYHSGLLALETGITAAAKEYFTKADQLGQSDAAAMLGLMLIREGRADEATAKLMRAMELKTSIPDVYAGLSEIFAAQGDFQRAEQFSALFTKRTGRKSFPSYLPAGSVEAETLTEPRSMAQRLMTEDSRTLGAATLDTALPQTTHNAQDSLIASLKAKQNSPQNTSLSPADSAAKGAKKSGETLSLLPSWVSWATFLTVGIITFGVFILGYYFLRWRKRQLATMALNTPAEVPATPKFDEEFQQAFSASNQQKAAELYQKATEMQNEEKIEEPPKDDWYEEPQEEQVPELPIEPDATEEQNSFENIAQRRETTDFYPNFSEENELTPDAHETDFDALAQKLRRGKAELEFAVNILSRQRQETQEKSLPIQPEEIPDRPGDLARMAKKLGVGKAELEIKRNISSLSADDSAVQEKMEKYASLFGKNQD